MRQELSLSSVGTSDLGLHLFLSLVFCIPEMGKKQVNIFPVRWGRKIKSLISLCKEDTRRNSFQ